jgi:hypothetical protein
MPVVLTHEIRNDRPDIYLWHDLLEPYDFNGGPNPVSPETHFFGLTSDPYLLAEEAALEDDGNLTVYGRLWHDPNYMLRSIPIELAKGEKVILKCWHNTNGVPETRKAFP